MNKYGLYGKLTVKPGKGKELEAILLEAANLIHHAIICRTASKGNKIRGNWR